ncbi:hypothetical protein Tco_0742921 [Tanacetum coccineum]
MRKKKKARPERGKKASSKVDHLVIKRKKARASYRKLASKEAAGVLGLMPIVGSVASSKQETVGKQESASKRRQARVVKQESASKSRQARDGKQESASKSRQARDGKQESSSKSRQARVDKQDRKQNR